MPSIKINHSRAKSMWFRICLVTWMIVCVVSVSAQFPRSPLMSSKAITDTSGGRKTESSGTTWSIFGAGDIVSAVKEMKLDKGIGAGSIGGVVDGTDLSGYLQMAVASTTRDTISQGYGSIVLAGSGLLSPSILSRLADVLKWMKR